MKELVFLTNQFPFGFGEAFIEAEFEYISKEFEQITIVALTDDNNQTRRTPSNCKLLNYNTTSTLIQKILIPFQILRNLRTFFFFMAEELEIIRGINIKLNFNILRKIFHDLVKGIQLYTFINKKIGFKDQDSFFYSYWLASQATALMIAKHKNKKLLAISRGHSIDIYPFRTPLNYIPFEKQKIEILNRVFFVSKHGINFYNNFFNYTTNKISLAPLGTDAIYRKSKNLNHSGKNTLLSISNIVEVKRLDLIIEALYLIDEIEITWIHIGDGSLNEYIVSLAKDRLKKKLNIKFEFLGQMLNHEVQKFLASHHVDLFINVSKIEAIPVTIREAMSYRIPCVATDVGGNSEIVNVTNGFLLDANPHPSQIAKTIQEYFKQPHDVKQQYEISAYEFWNQNYNSEVIYPKFVAEIRSLINSH